MSPTNRAGANEGDPTLEMVTRIEDSLVDVMKRNREKLLAFPGLNAYSLDLFPWFGYVILGVRGRATAKDSQYYSLPEGWDGDSFLDSAEDELPEFDWLVRYMKNAHKRLHRELGGHPYRWDQWLRLCAAIAISQDRVSDALKEGELPSPRSIESPMALCRMFYVVPYGESRMASTGYNFVGHACALRIASGGKLSTPAISEMYDCASMPGIDSPAKAQD